MTPQELIDACRAWCALMGVEPLPPPADEESRHFLCFAIRHWSTPFDQLTTGTRQIIASCPDID